MPGRARWRVSPAILPSAKGFMMNGKFAGMEMSVDRPERLPLLHPTTRQTLRDADGKEAFLELYSQDSKIARDHTLAIQRRRLRAARGRLRIEPEEIEADTVDLLAALTAGWHLVGLNGTVLDVPFSTENARELYSAPQLAWVREQADEFINDRGNFKPAS